MMLSLILSRVILDSFPISRQMFTLIALLIESIELDTMWNSVIDTVEEAVEGNTPVKLEPI